MKLTFTPRFFTDVEECADYLATEASPEVAAAWYQALKKALKRIRQVPAIGRLRQDLPMEGIRTLNLHKYPNYLIFYRLKKEAIEILRVRHGMMNLPELLVETDG